MSAVKRLRIAGRQLEAKMGYSASSGCSASGCRKLGPQSELSRSGAFAAARAIALGKVPNLAADRDFILVGCAFPDSLAAVSAPVGYIERHDWKFACSFSSSRRRACVR